MNLTEFSLPFHFNQPQPGLHSGVGHHSEPFNFKNLTNFLVSVYNYILPTLTSPILVNLTGSSNPRFLLAYEASFGLIPKKSLFTSQNVMEQQHHITWELTGRQSLRPRLTPTDFHVIHMHMSFLQTTSQHPPHPAHHITQLWISRRTFPDPIHRQLPLLGNNSVTMQPRKFMIFYLTRSSMWLYNL